MLWLKSGLDAEMIVIILITETNRIDIIIHFNWKNSKNKKLNLKTSCQFRFI